ncbi:uncharacterized protein LOC129747620 [Uranotaenia lowii]|uniref:uncharacterized protein LOC129747620 n=1 Tax=Uranotaenia lowii TaxID=190385 RepID=UPI002479667C|nr:uncharacterized protein LOC129747620 [Uranotaenia lowii]
MEKSLRGLAMMVLLMVATGSDFRGAGVAAQFTGPTLACGGTSLLKTTTLITPALVSTNCVYKIRAINLRVCQLRLDFNSFNLIGPSITPSVPYPHCSSDVLSVENLDFTLCGENSGQHLYVPFTPSVTDLTFTIEFKLAPSAARQSTPYWNIRVQQLECPVGASFASKAAFRAELPPLVKTFHNDLGVLAPTGCLQYHTASNGIIKSFNFDNGGPYPANLNYAICFRRGRESEGLRLHASVFDLGFGSADGYDGACFANIATPGRSEDYLYIPNAVAGNDPQQLVRATRFCSKSIHQKTVEATPPGPYVLQFNSDSIYGANGATETGFQITYEII